MLFFTIVFLYKAMWYSLVFYFFGGGGLSFAASCSIAFRRGRKKVQSFSKKLSFRKKKVKVFKVCADNLCRGGFSLSAEFI